MASSRPPSTFALHRITFRDYPVLTNISILSMMQNPFHYLTYTPAVNHADIVAYMQASKIESAYEGKEFQTLKIVDTSTPDQQIVGFASWRLEPTLLERESERPPGSDFTFVDEFRRRMGPVAGRHFNPETDIELLLMRILPSYQRRGIGTILLRWGIQQAERLGKRIFVLASPEGKRLYETQGFVGVGEVRMDLAEFGTEGIYVQTVMIWDGPDGPSRRG